MTLCEINTLTIRGIFFIRLRKLQLHLTTREIHFRNMFLFYFAHFVYFRPFKLPYGYLIERYSIDMEEWKIYIVLEQMLAATLTISFLSIPQQFFLAIAFYTQTLLADVRTIMEEIDEENITNVEVKKLFIKAIKLHRDTSR